MSLRILFLAIVGVAAAAAAAEPLMMTGSTPGNVFVSADAVKIPIRTTGDSIAWTATDYWGSQVSGFVPVRNGQATIRPQLGRLGYFDLRVSARSGGAELAQADTAFAVIHPPDGRAGAASPFGVMTHFAQGWNTDLMPLLARAGITQIRDEQYWDNVEAIRGSYVYPARYRDYMTAAAANGLHPLIEMTFANAAYDHQPDSPRTAVTPYTDEGRNGFADYGRAILKQYGSQVNALEVWNEYNGTWCNGPAAGDRPASYAALLKTAYARIKAARPDVTVLGGAAALAPLPWFEDIFAHGALDSMDALVIHPYRDVPEGVELDVAAIVAAMKAANHGVAKPIWATECSSAGDAEPARRASARYLVRLMTLLRSAEVARIYWYLGKDYNEFTTGLLHAENSPLGKYAPTATYAAYAVLISQLRDAAPVRREEAGDPRTRVYLFQRGAAQKRVAWSVRSPSRLVLQAPAALTVTNLMGESKELAPVNGSITVPLEQDPVYIAGEVTSLRDTGQADRQLTDAAEGFSATQGQGGWSYGYFEAGGGAYDPAAFRPMAWKRSEYAYRWEAPYPFMYIAAASTHPGSATAKPVWAVRRWQADVTGVVHVEASLAADGRKGDGVAARVFRDGKELFAQALGGASGSVTAQCRLDVPVVPGTILDFALTPGPAADTAFDATTFRAEITLPAQSP